jgi:hypothetical protein
LVDLLAFHIVEVRVNWICFCVDEVAMKFGHFSFGCIEIADATYQHDAILDRGQILKRKKKPSKRFQNEFGHTPLSVEEDIPWKCKQLIIGTGEYAGCL